MTPFDVAWSIIKALPEESLFSQRSRGDYRGGYGRMPFRSIFQTRHKTMHPAVQGIMNRGRMGSNDARGRIHDKGVNPPRHVIDARPDILSVPTLDRAERNAGTGGYHMMGSADNDPDITSWARRGSIDDPYGHTRRSEDFARYNLDERDKERLADTLNLKDMSGTLDFMNPKSEYEHLVTRGPDGAIRFPGYDENGHYIF